MKTKYTLHWIAGTLSLFFVHCIAADTNPFTAPVPLIEMSPSQATMFPLASGAYVIDFAVNPIRPLVVVLLKTQSGGQQIVFWQMNTGIKSHQITWAVPSNLAISSILWHPSGHEMFLLAKQTDPQAVKPYEILKTKLDTWRPSVIFQSQASLKNLVIGPRPFQGGKQNNEIFYRLFFGIKKMNSAFTIHSITENGSYELTVVDSSIDKTLPQYQYTVNPNAPIAVSSLPVAFHPAGQMMIWQDQQNCFHTMKYEVDGWNADSAIKFDPPLCNGSLAFTPNGAALLHWKGGAAGVVLEYDQRTRSEVVAHSLQFVSAPQSVADGKGLVGITKINNPKMNPQFALQYIPIHMPLADVLNAWMFLQSPQDRELFSKNSGLFRAMNADANQLYQLYDSESYQPDAAYDQSTPTRPYFVTTDIFWELYSAAFEGIFVVSERQAAIPAFWNFVEKANTYLKLNVPQSKMAAMFAAIMAVRDGNRENNAETQRIMQAEGMSTSAISNSNFDFGDLKPRGHYTLDTNFQNYFKATKYLTLVPLHKEDVAILQKLPDAIKQSALAWIKVYEPFIAPSKSPLVWDKSFPLAATLHPDKNPQTFPLSWGLDNEILNNTINHLDWPPAEQICNHDFTVCRVLPSGLDIAAVLGSDMALNILAEEGEFNKFPSLKMQIEKLKNYIKQSHALQNSPATLYQRWIEALATQWAQDVSSPGNAIQQNLWQRKRLQTGLAAWTTLRHATLLVNARVAAEAGEGGYETLVLEPPRGYVEPDPKTFAAIADLFDATINWVKFSGKNWSLYSSTDHQAAVNDLQNGIIRRLMESRDKIRRFGNIAAKEIAQQPLTADDYQEILYVGRAAEHNFLVFKSLAQKDYALSSPDPNPKIADIAASDKNIKFGRQFLFSAVGYPLEWDQIISLYGHKEIVKGAVYSYYEFASSKMINDEEWRKMAATQPRPDWIAPFVTNEVLAFPPKY